MIRKIQLSTILNGDIGSIYICHLTKNENNAISSNLILSSLMSNEKYLKSKLTCTVRALVIARSHNLTN